MPARFEEGPVLIGGSKRLKNRQKRIQTRRRGKNLRVQDNQRWLLLGAKKTALARPELRKPAALRGSVIIILIIVADPQSSLTRDEQRVHAHKLSRPGRDGRSAERADLPEDLGPRPRRHQSGTVAAFENRFSGLP